MMNKTILILAVVVLVFGMGAVSYFIFYGKSSQPSSSSDDFAKCLASKNITMYGTYNCPHCLNEKKAFGSSFQYILYVECTQEPNKCVDAGIVEVPTWVFPDGPSAQAGKKLIGEQGLEKLSKESGCPLPLK